MGSLQDESNGVSTSSASSVEPDLASSSSSSNFLIKETPRMQVMDRSMDESHRIPSSVFELDHSSDPVQWSTSSSDSLFSIYIGGTSISLDDSYHWCSDEHGTTGEEEEEEEEADGPVPLRTVSDRHSVKLRQVETSLETVNEEEEEDSRESEDDSHEKSFAQGRGSNASVKSFAFPILSGELDKDSPGNLGCTARFSEQQQPEPSMEETEPLPKPEPSGAPQKSWFSCFPCCS